MLSIPKKYFFLLIALIVSFFSLTSVVNAEITSTITDEECQRDLETGREHLEECIDVWNKLSSQKAEAITTLKTELSRFDASVALATAQIYTTVAEIEKIEEEVGALSTKIGYLDVSLDQLSQILVKRIAETYKKGKIDSFAPFFQELF